MKIDTRKNIAVLDNSADTIDGDIIYLCFLLRNRIIQFIKIQLLRLQVKNERHTLSKLTDRELDDMGISRHDALKESNKGLGNLPANRLNHS